MTKSAAKDVTPFGTGMTVSVANNVLTIAIPFDPDRLSSCDMSATGKSLCVAKTSGHLDVPDTPLRLNVYAGIPTKRLQAQA